LEEFESIRLLDYENLSQVEASELMEISRPTLTRIYERARKKVAQALTEANQILIEGGYTFYSSEWKYCNTCDSRFNIVSATNQEKCPLCQNNQITEVRGMNQC
jgi:predicted Zn-ribbon and HTH transcriptional regulator